jgi:hypothetical protein
MPWLQGLAVCGHCRSAIVSRWPTVTSVLIISPGMIFSPYEPFVLINNIHGLYLKSYLQMRKVYRSKSDNSETTTTGRNEHSTLILNLKSRDLL